MLALTAALLLCAAAASPCTAVANGSSAAVPGDGGGRQPGAKLYLCPSFFVQGTDLMNTYLHANVSGLRLPAKYDKHMSAGALGSAGAFNWRVGDFLPACPGGKACIFVRPTAAGVHLWLGEPIELKIGFDYYLKTKLFECSGDGEYGVKLALDLKIDIQSTEDGHPKLVIRYGKGVVSDEYLKLHGGICGEILNFIAMVAMAVGNWLALPFPFTINQNIVDRLQRSVIDPLPLTYDIFSGVNIDYSMPLPVATKSGVPEEPLIVSLATYFFYKGHRYDPKIPTPVNISNDAPANLFTKGYKYGYCTTEYYEKVKGESDPMVVCAKLDFFALLQSFFYALELSAEAHWDFNSTHYPHTENTVHYPGANGPVRLGPDVFRCDCTEPGACIGDWLPPVRGHCGPDGTVGVYFNIVDGPVFRRSAKRDYLFRVYALFNVSVSLYAPTGRGYSEAGELVRLRADNLQFVLDKYAPAAHGFGFSEPAVDRRFRTRWQYALREHAPPEFVLSTPAGQSKIGAYGRWAPQLVRNLARGLVQEQLHAATWMKGVPVPTGGGLQFDFVTESLLLDFPVLGLCIDIRLATFM